MSSADADSGRGLRLYTVLVDLHRKVEVEVVAANEDDARQQARETAVSQLPAADAWSTEILKAADVTVAIGSRITHELFGTGTVQAVVTLASASRKGYSQSVVVRTRRLLACRRTLIRNSWLTSAL